MKVYEYIPKRSLLCFHSFRSTRTKEVCCGFGMQGREDECDEIHGEGDSAVGRWLYSVL